MIRVDTAIRSAPTPHNIRRVAARIITAGVRIISRMVFNFCALINMINVIITIIIIIIIIRVEIILRILS
jgi:hypothetical protein